MPHADTSIVPEEIKTKEAFYDHVLEGLTALVEGQDFWVTNLANASSLLYHCYLNSPLYGARPDGEPVVNWCGFYLRPPPYPSTSSSEPDTTPLLLGPFNGRPACQLILPRPGRGVCADSFLTARTLIVPDVHLYPGHIACDASSASEIVLPLRRKGDGVVIGVLDVDSTVKNTFGEVDRVGLERIVELLSIQG